MTIASVEQLQAERDSALSVAHVSLQLLEDLSAKTAAIVLSILTQQILEPEIVVVWVDLVSASSAEAARLRSQLANAAPAEPESAPTGNPSATLFRSLFLHRNIGEAR